MSIKRFAATGLLAMGLGATAQVQAGAIFSATSAVINAGGPGFGTLAETHNQTGLFTGYVDGVTDFDTYIAGNPIHTLVFAGNEWFSNQGSTSASVTYNFGAARTFDALALWNEDFAGIGSLDLLTSTDGVTFTALASALLPPDNTNNLDYGADVFSFGAVTAQYVRFDMSGCPQQPAGFNSCAIGEVAFRETAAAVPEPGVLALTGLALLGLVASRRRKR